MTSSNNNHNEVVPYNKLLLNFLNEATNELNDCTKLESPLSLNEIRKHLLEIQTKCLDRIVAQYNNNNNNTNNNKSGIIITVEEVQHRLRNINNNINGKKKDGILLRDASEKMNDSARLAFGRLVLYNECCLKHPNRTLRERMTELKGSGRMTRSDILEFIGLCDVVIRLPHVQQYVRNETPTLFSTNNEVSSSSSSPTISIFPQERLEYVQRMILQAIGYDSQHGYNEIKRIFFTCDSNNNEFSNDVELLDRFTAMSNRMDEFIRETTACATLQTLSLNDHNQGGVTRVVSVQYSEKFIDEQTGEEIEGHGDTSQQQHPAGGTTLSSEPRRESMESHRHSTNEDGAESAHHQQQQREQLRIAKQTSILEQEILHELLSMRDEERDKRLEEATQAKQQFLMEMNAISDAINRVQYVQSINPRTQKLLLMERIWTSEVLSKNNGQPPILHSQQQQQS